jgi:hypothetical protein
MPSKQDGFISLSEAAARREQMAEEGDICGLMVDIEHAPGGTVEWNKRFQQLRRAIEVASRKEPRAFADEVFRNMITFAMYANVRLSLVCQTMISTRDTSAHSPASLPGDLTSDTLPQLIQLQGHLAQLMHSWASTQRQLDLVSSRQRGVRSQKRAKARKKPTEPKRPPQNGFHDFGNSSN